MAKIITFTNQKGGVGKTTSCINTAAYVAKAGKRVLVVDMDPQGNASSGLGIIEKNKCRGIYGVLIGEYPVNDNVIQPTSITNLDIIPTSTNLAGAEVELAIMGEHREYVLKDALTLVRENYDFIMIDCPPSLGLLTVNALTASDSIIIPIQCEYFALEGLSQLVYTVKQVRQYLNKTLEIEGILLTMYDKRSKLTLQVEAEIKKFFADKLYKTRIPRNIRLAEAPSHGVPIMTYDSNCQGAKAYAELAKEIISANK